MKKIFVILLLCSLHSPGGASHNDTEEPSTTTDLQLVSKPAPARHCVGYHLNLGDKPQDFLPFRLQCFIKYRYNTVKGCYLADHGAAKLTEQDDNKHTPHTPHCDFDATTNDVIVTCSCYTTDCNHNLSTFQTVLQNDEELRWPAGSNTSAPLLYCLVKQARADAEMQPLPGIATTTVSRVASCIKGDSDNASSVTIANKDQERVVCTIEYQWTDTGCVLSKYGVDMIGYVEDRTPFCVLFPFVSAVCHCYETECNRDLRYFRDTLKNDILWKNETKGSEEFASCLLEKSNGTAPSLYCLHGKPDNVIQDTSGWRGLSRCTVKFEKNGTDCALVEYGMIPIMNEEENAAGLCTPRDSSSVLCHCLTDNCNAEFHQFHNALQSLDAPTCIPSPRCAIRSQSDYEERAADDYCYVRYSPGSGHAVFGAQKLEQTRNGREIRMCQLIADDVICFCKYDKCNHKDIFQSALLYDEDWKALEGTRLPDLRPNLKMRYCGESVGFDPWDRKVCVKQFFKKPDNTCTTWIGFHPLKEAEGCAPLPGKEIVECVCKTAACSDTHLKSELAKVKKRIVPGESSCLGELLSCPTGSPFSPIDVVTAAAHCTVELKVEPDGTCSVGEFSNSEQKLAEKDHGCLKRAASGGTTCFCSHSGCTEEMVEMLRGGVSPLTNCTERIENHEFFATTLPATSTSLSTVASPAEDGSTNEAATDEPTTEGDPFEWNTEETGISDDAVTTTVSPELETSTPTDEVDGSTNTKVTSTTEEPAPDVPSTTSGGTTEEITGTTEDGTVEGGGNEESGKEAEKEEKAGFPEWAIWLIAIVVLSAILGFIIFVVVKKVLDKKEREGQEKTAEAEALIPQVVVQKPAVPEVKPAVPEVKPAVPEVKSAVPGGKPAVPEQKPVVPEQKPAVPEQKKASAAEEKQDPTKKPAAPAKRLTLRQMLEKEAIEREKKKNRRQKLLKANRAQKPDVFSDRRFQKAGPLKFTHFSKYLPEDNLTSSGSIKGDGPIEFNDRENKIYLMGSEIEEIEPSPEGTQDSEDETQDSVDSTQDSNKVAGQKKAARKDRKRGEDGKKEKKVKKEKKAKKHKRRKKARDGKSRSKGGTKRHGHKKRSGTKKHRKGHKRSREGASRGSGTKTSGKDQLTVEGSRQSVRSQAAMQAEVAVNEKKGQMAGGSRRQEVEQGK